MHDAPIRSPEPAPAHGPLGWQHASAAAVATEPCRVAGLSWRVQRRLLLCLAAGSLACASAVRPGDTVDIADESAIIIWDAPARTQHFIRRASFRTAAKDFGFLVPTPAVPELKEASQLAFSYLDRLTESHLPRSATAGDAPPAAAAARPPVAVVAQAKVAGYDAVVLEAPDTKALDAWLRQHGYASSPQLMEWVRPYLERGWKISAFKIDRDPARSVRAESGAVRMSFKTDAPFFPYREPVAPPGAASGTQARSLRVYLLATTQMEGALEATTPWPGRLDWSNRMDESARARLFEELKLPDTVAPGAFWLTRFTDSSSPRPGVADLTFRPAAYPSPHPQVAPAPGRVELGARGYLMGLVSFAAVVALVAGLLYAGCRLLVHLLQKARS